VSLSLKKTSSTEQRTVARAGGRGGSTLVPAVARVNLLPKEITERRGLRSLQRLLALVLLAVVILGAILTFGSSRMLGDAKDALSQEEQRTTRLLAEQRRYAAVTAVTDRLRLTNDALEYVSRSDVDWALVLGMIASVTPEEVLVAEMKADTETPLVGGSDNAKPLEPANIGTFELTGTALTRPDASTWATDLEALPGVAEARISVVEQADTAAEKFYKVTVTMILDPSLQRADGRIANIPAEETD